MARGMAQGDRLAKFKRVTDLFEHGRIVVLDEPENGDPVCVWVSKLNPFEMEEARRDGAVGRARAQMRLEDDDSPEREVFEQALTNRDGKALAAALCHAKQNEDYVKALDDIRAIPEWRAKLDVLDRADAQIADAGKVDEAEAERLSLLNQEYIAKIDELYQGYQAERLKDLEAMSIEVLQKTYRDQYLETASGAGFLTEFRITETFYALRDCSAKRTDGGEWSHADCDHSLRLCEARSDVRELPEGLLDKVRGAMAELSMSPRDAGNSDAPASSSASSEQPSAEAASTPSTPAEK